MKVKAKKHFGQNFLNDKNIIQKIVASAQIDSSTIVIEVGPGTGNLTKYLLDKAHMVVAYEIDADLISPLKTRFSEAKNFKLIQNDILKSNLINDVEPYLGDNKEVVVVANLPYYITTPILMHLIETADFIKSFTVMVQHEVGKRFSGIPGTKDYNSLSVYMQYKFDVKYLFKVPASVFTPKPNVDSAVIQLNNHQTYEGLLNDEPFFFSLVRTAFTQRRKTLVNNIYILLNMSKSDVEEQLEHIGFDKSIRAERLSIEDFIRISNHFKGTL
jgi:16S rRNA (adenine1518-N6/adenine1519-N6)-dimethyltransferase